MVDYALDRLFFSLTASALVDAVAAELGSIDVLDGVSAREGVPAAWARGVERVAIVSSDTTIGVAIVPAVFALCAKCAVVVKDRNDALTGAFFSSLAEEHSAFAEAARAEVWTGGADPREDALLGAAGVVVAFGGDEALRAIRGRCGSETRFVPFGHRTSIGFVRSADLAALDAASADVLVRDALLYDGEGCLSLHALFVEAAGEELLQVAHALARACERMSVEFPAAERHPARAAAVAAYRNLAAFRAAGGEGVVLRGGDATLVVGPPPGDPPPLLPRVLPILPVGSGDDVVRYVAEHRLPVQGLAVATPDAAAVSLAQRIGAVRVARFGTLQDPPLGGHHGGQPRISDFVRWIDAQ